MNDDIETLLDLADGERALPGDLEEQLLRQVVETASPVDGTPPPNVETAAVTALSDVHPRGARHGTRPRTLTLVAAAAIVVAVIIVGFAGRDDSRPVASDPPPTSEPAIAPLADLDDRELCETITNRLSAAGYEDITSTPSAALPTELERLADAVAEYALRNPDDDLDLLILALRSAVVEGRAGTAGAPEAALRRVADLLAGSPFITDC